MTKCDQLNDEILGIEAALHGKRLELAMWQGQRVDAQSHRLAMEAAVNARRELRLRVGMQDGGCFFNAAGHADQVAKGRVVHA
ncbi:MAG: hypothetical protein WAW73_20255 [Rhodoferax sp.]